MADADTLRATLGVEPGSVTPMGLVNAAPGSVRLALDAALARAEGLVWVHPLVNTASVGLAAPELLRFLERLGHSVQVLELDRAD
jgi:Ala-tRNA(Pro) deacylase